MSRPTLEDDIRRRAYELWEAEGRPDGRAADHWQVAQSQLAAAGNDSAAPGKKPRRSNSTARPKSDSAAVQTRVMAAKTPRKAKRSKT